MARAPAKGAKERWAQIAEHFVPLLVTMMVPLVGGLWVLFTYLENQRELAEKRATEAASQIQTRRIELQKPFIDQQFQTYNDFVKVMGELLASRADSREWYENKIVYWKLHWSRVALVEDEEVHQTKRQFAKALKDYEVKVYAGESLFDKLMNIEDKLKKVDEEFKLYPNLLAEEKRKLEQEREETVKARDALRAELDSLRSIFEEASVPLTTALRRGIQKSWTTGELGR